MTHIQDQKNQQYENEILELIENRDDYTQSDLQGIVGALVLKMTTPR